MKTRTLITLLAVLAALVIAGTLVQRRTDRPGSGDDLGTPLFRGLTMERVEAVVLSGPKGAVSLKKTPAGWVVVERGGYPAAFGKISDLARRLRDAKVGRRFNASAETLDRLALRGPDESDAPEEARAIRVALKDDKGTLIAGLLVGRMREGGPEKRLRGGRYVRLDGEREVCLVDQEFRGLSTNPAAWLKKELVRVPAEEVRSITCLENTGGPALFRVERREKGKDLELMGLGKGQRAQKASLNRLGSALSSLRLQDVLASPEPSVAEDFSRTPVLEYRLFDGKVYRVRRVREGSKNNARDLLRMEVAYEPPAVVDEQGKDKGRHRSPEENVLEARQENARLSPWVFVVGKWQADAFMTRKTDLLEKRPEPPEKKAPSRPSTPSRPGS
ncbi:MAG: DUF4340 domain-containing protein [Deltaproteobacteria bacterium]|nr:DUF4340 domain-containing protein [Deltaproteobacteria bacterium]MBW1924103.1 DUF4340 domain-containing protein [Deltaproteobacteria bacterium]MBW1950541.1 DUF4340 domain-containing protein [Deltaproteobacteria bacterium]MBW2007564.1 DUF4340 domain-containing protein [Deltaproteobacteria bacterium]MBW2102954.1 DUF4340 domain-containing protein [Deltaproteobacteria bacterium]